MAAAYTGYTCLFKAKDKSTVFQNFLVLKTCASHRFNVNSPLNLCDAHLQKSKKSEITC